MLWSWFDFTSRFLAFHLNKWEEYGWKFSKFNWEFSPKFHANLAFIDGKSKAPNQQKSRSNVRYYQRKNSCHKRFRDSFLLSSFYLYYFNYYPISVYFPPPFFGREKLKTKRHEIAENAKVKNDSHEDKPKIGPQISQGWFREPMQQIEIEINSLRCEGKCIPVIVSSLGKSNCRSCRYIYCCCSFFSRIFFPTRALH